MADALEHVAPGAVAGVEVAHEADLAELLEVAIDGRDIGLSPVAAKPVGDLLRRDRLGRRQERLEHEAPRGRQAQPAGADGSECSLQIGDDHRAAVGRDRHSMDRNARVPCRC